MDMIKMKRKKPKAITVISACVLAMIAFVGILYLVGIMS